MCDFFHCAWHTEFITFSCRRQSLASKYRSQMLVSNLCCLCQEDSLRFTNIHDLFDFSFSSIEVLSQLILDHRVFLQLGSNVRSVFLHQKHHDTFLLLDSLLFSLPATASLVPFRQLQLFLLSSFLLGLFHCMEAAVFRQLLWQRIQVELRAGFRVLFLTF